MNKKILIMYLLFFIHTVWATVQATVDRTQISLGQSLTLTINIDNTSDTPDLSVLQQAFDVSGTGKSTQTSIINGHMSSQTTFSVNLTPKNPGKQLIPAIKAGNAATTPIQIEVSTAANNPIARHGDYSIEATVADKSSYVGVPILLNVKFYYSVQVGNLSMEQISMPDVRIEPLGKPNQYQSNNGDVNYGVVEQKFLLTPSKSGTLTIPSVRIQGVISTNDNNGFFAMAGPRAFTARTKPITVTIKPIPEGMAKSSWLPAKGLDLTDSWSADSAVLKVGEPITRTIVVKALGITAASIPDINFQAPANTNTYPDKVAADSKTDNDQLIGSKVFKIAYIPIKTGKLDFPEIKLQWWDIDSSSVKTAIIPAKSYIVEAESNPALTGTVSLPSASPLASTIQQLPKPILANKLWFYLTWVFAVLWLITLIAAVILLFKCRKNKSLKAQVEDVVSIKASKALAQIHNACLKHDFNLLNQALISWATVYFNKKIYTVSDIADLADNQRLHELIDKLNLALYKGEAFTDYTEVEEEINRIRHQTAKTPAPLGEFYPK